ncbi:hypothetical protein DL765_011077 [Monosporascus sp. GIB2]|nr:hypothetical protein DL765_011077 [Monosporascus sp. GIB2]
MDLRERVRQELRARGLPDDMPSELPTTVCVPASPNERAEAQAAMTKLQASEPWGKRELLALAPYMRSVNKAPASSPKAADSPEKPPTAQKLLAATKAVNSPLSC